MTPSTLLSSFAEDVRHYLQLTPRQLPSLYLYDGLGSALFDAICELPWYAITRAESRLLERHRRDIFAHLPGLTRIVELGPGDGRKLQTLVDGTAEPLTAHLIDVSAGALARATHTLSDAFNVTVFPHQASFEDGLDAIAHTTSDDRTLVLFLGSNIGNFDRPGAEAFLRGIRGNMAAGDAFLLGADLVKPEADLLLAYDDPLGVTAAFNRNLLVRINRELGGDFVIEHYAHRALWNAGESRVEMHLVAQSPQRVRIDAAQLDFEMKPREPIWTESSYKYRADEIVDLLEESGFRVSSQWLDEVDRFALTLSAAG